MSDEKERENEKKRKRKKKTRHRKNRFSVLSLFSHPRKPGQQEEGVRHQPDGLDQPEARPPQVGQERAREAHARRELVPDERERQEHVGDGLAGRGGQPRRDLERGRRRARRAERRAARPGRCGAQRARRGARGEVRGGGERSRCHRRRRSESGVRRCRCEPEALGERPPRQLEVLLLLPAHQVSQGRRRRAARRGPDVSEAVFAQRRHFKRKGEAPFFEKMTRRTRENQNKQTKAKNSLFCGFDRLLA